MGCLQVNGQDDDYTSFEKQAEIVLSYGISSSNFKNGPYERRINRGFFSGNVSFKNKKTTEVYRVTTKGDINTKETVGISLAFEANQKEVYRFNQLIGALNAAYFILVFDWEYNFIKTNWIRMYAGASFGVGYFFGNFEPSPTSQELEQSIEQTVISYQGTLLGIRLGDTIAIIAEFGYGYKGTINAGVSYRF